MDGRIRHWFYPRRSSFRYLWPKMVRQALLTIDAKLMIVRFFIAASVLGLIGTIIGASAQSINMLIVCTYSPLRWATADLFRPQTPSTVSQPLDNCLSTSVSESSYPTVSEVLSTHSCYRHQFRSLSLALQLLALYT